MKKLSETYKELGIAFTFPIEIRDSTGKVTYFEDSHGWYKKEYDSNGNKTYYENSDNCWYKKEYDSNGNKTYYEDSDGIKRGTPRSQACDGKVVEIDGIKYELTMKITL